MLGLSHDIFIPFLTDHTFTCVIYSHVLLNCSTTHFFCFLELWGSKDKCIQSQFGL